MDPELVGVLLAIIASIAYVGKRDHAELEYGIVPGEPGELGSDLTTGA